MSKRTVYLKDYIGSKDTDEIQYESFDIIDISVDKETFMGKNILHEYLDDLEEMVKIVPLTEKEYYTYIYRPRLLANRLYGNPNLYYILLMLNNICNEKEFTMRQVRVILAEDLFRVLGTIYSVNKDYINYHRRMSEKKRV